MAVDPYLALKQSVDQSVGDIEGKFRRAQLTDDSRVLEALPQEISSVFWEIDELSGALNTVKSAPNRYGGISIKELDARDAHIKQQRERLNAVQKGLSAGRTTRKSTKSSVLGTAANPEFEARPVTAEQQRAEQVTIMREQDQILDRFHETVSTIGNMSRTIGGELEEHNRILEEFDYEVDDTQTRLTSATKYVDKLIESISNNKYWCTILLLFVILLVVIVIAIALP